MRVQFGECVFDTASRQLFRGDRAIHLSPKAFRLLELLIERRPAVIPRDQIHATIWPDTYVSEATLASLIAEIRSGIGEEAAQTRFIRTVHRVGYAFCGEARELREIAPAPTQCEWRLIWNDREIALSEGDNLLGRDHSAAVWIDDESVSRRHAIIRVTGAEAVLEDLRSKNGTFVNGADVGRMRAVYDGDQVRLGVVTLLVRAFPVEKSTRTEQRSNRNRSP